MHGAKFLYAVSPSGLNAKFSQTPSVRDSDPFLLKKLSDLSVKTASPPVGNLTLPRNYLIL